MLFVAIVATSWTIWLIILTIDPNATANYLMDTSKFDDGSFWLIIDPEPVLMTVSVCGLTAVALGYLHVLAKMTIRRQSHVKWALFKKKESWIQHLWSHSSLKKIVERSWIVSACVELTGFNGRYRKLWVRDFWYNQSSGRSEVLISPCCQNMCLKVADLIVQTVALVQLLENGIPVQLVCLYTGIVASNALVFSLGILLPRYHSSFIEILVDAMYGNLARRSTCETTNISIALTCL